MSQSINEPIDQRVNQSIDPPKFFKTKFNLKGTTTADGCDGEFVKATDAGVGAAAAAAAGYVEDHLQQLHEAGASHPHTQQHTQPHPNTHQQQQQQQQQQQGYSGVS